MLQRGDEKCASANAAKAERNCNMMHGSILNVIATGNQQ